LSPILSNPSPPFSEPPFSEELGSGLYACDEQMIAGSGAGHVEQMAFGIVDLPEVSVISDSLDLYLL
jgi:hypothetical protein